MKKKKTNQQLANKLAVQAYVRQLKANRRFAIPGILLPGIGVTLTDYVPALIIAAFIKRFGDSESLTLETITPYLLAFGGIWLLGEVCWRIAFQFLIQVNKRSMSQLYKDAMSELFKKDIYFFHDNFAGSLTKKATAYGRYFERFLDTFAFKIVANGIPLIFAVIILWSYSPILAFVLVGFMSLVGVIVLPLIKRRAKLVAEREISSNIMAGHIADIISNVDTVQSFRHEAYEFDHHAKNVADFMDKSQKSWHYHNTRIDMLVAPIHVFINVVGLAIAILLSDDPSTTATIFVTFAYFSRATHILFEFNGIYRDLESSITEAAQFTKLLIDPPSLMEKPGAKQLKAKDGVISFKDVTFSYRLDGDEEPLFEKLNLAVNAGEKIALVGHSGSGKTTITKLLLRFTDVHTGELLIDGQNIADVTLDSLRQSIAYVPQEPALFHRTLHENIRYGKLDADDNAVRHAAELAHAHEFIKDLPHGYDTLVGERGVKLSGGQRQRIAIARAMLKNAPILVLDEATSALDSESEALIQDALWKLMESKTTIVIAHRLSTIQKMDRIIVLDNGKIIEQGPHKELLKLNGTYAKLWSHQSGGFIEE